MTKSKEILSHTADIKIRITAETLSGLFLMALESMNQILVPNFKSQEYSPSIMESIHLQAADTTSLLIDFLSETLTLSQIHKAIFYDFEIQKLSYHALAGILRGTFVNAFSEDVKAVTYHEAEVKVDKSGNWETIIIFDI